MKRSIGQTGGFIGRAPVILLQQTYREPEQTAFNGRYMESAVRVTLNHNLHEITDILSAASCIDSAIQQIVEPLLAEACDRDFVAMSVQHPDLESDGIRMPFCQRGTFNPRTFLNSIYHWVQSNSSCFLIDGQMILRVSILRSLVGHGRHKSVEKIDSYFHPKMIMRINGRGSSCGWLALTLAKLLADEPLMRVKDRRLYDRLAAPNSR